MGWNHSKKLHGETAVVAPARMTAAEILRAAAVVVNAVKTVMVARTVEAVVTKVPVAIKVTANAVNVVMTKKRETAVVAPARMTAAEILRAAAVVVSAVKTVIDARTVEAVVT